VENGQTYTQTFDVENRLAPITVGGQTTQFIGARAAEGVEGMAMATLRRAQGKPGEENKTRWQQNPLPFDAAQGKSGEILPELVKEVWG